MNSKIIGVLCRMPTMLLAYSLLLYSAILPADESFLTLERAVSIALEDNPSLAQIKARAEAMTAIPSQ